MKRQAVITGLGIVSPIGVGVEKFWEAAKAGRSGIGTPSLFDASKLPSECQIVGEVKDFNPRDWMSPQAARMAGRFSQFAVAAAKMARDAARLDEAEIPPERVKVSMGNSTLGLTDVFEPNLRGFLRGQEVQPWACLELPSHAATSHVAIANGVRGQTASFATACSGGLDAVGWASTEVERGDATAVVAGATESPLSELLLAAFHSVGVLAKWQGPPEEASRPFDGLRAGMVLAEGAAAVVIEDEADARARGAPSYARVLGSASASEGNHLRKVEETGETAARAMAMALQRSGLAPEEVDFICAHGNSMRDYDAAETAGIKQVFGRRAWSVPVSSLKSMCGQALAASSAMQVVVSCLILRHQIIPPTINYRVADPACDLDYVPNVARISRVRTVLVHVNSLGGLHVAMILASPG